MPKHRSTEELEAALPHIRCAPANHGQLSLIVRRPANNERETIPEGFLSKAEGLVGDNWGTRPKADPEMQLNIMNIRVAELVAQGADRIPLAGDQLYVDLDLDEDNLPIGTRLLIGEAEVEITAMPHLGCIKFVERFGRPAMEFVNSDLGKKLKLRGVNARVTREGCIRTGDTVAKVG